MIDTQPLRKLLLTLCCLIAGISSVARAQGAGSDWPWFLGPEHTGASAEKNLNLSWPEKGPPVLWGKQVGTGYSAPSIRGRRLVLHHRIDDEEITQCLDAETGDTQWTYRTPSDFVDPYGYNNGPRCSPVLTDSLCYTLGAGGHLACVKLASGEPVWRRDLHEEFQIPRGFFGVGCSPILEGDKLIVLVGGQLNSGVVAFDAAGGKKLWSAVGRETWQGVEQPRRGPYRWTGTEQIVSYSSPIAATIHGKRHLLCLMRHGLVSLDPENGDERFRYWFRPLAHESVNAARPVVIGDKILLSAAYRLGSVLLEVAESGTAVEEVWKDSENLLAHWSTPIVVDGYAYGFSGRHESEGELRCINLTDGKIMWATTGYEPETYGRVAVDRQRRVYVNEETGKEVPRPFFGRGSKILVDKHFIILGERGLLAVARVNAEKYEEVCRTEFSQIHFPSWTAPVLSRGRLYLRCEDALMCLNLRLAEK